MSIARLCICIRSRTVKTITCCYSLTIKRTCFLKIRSQVYQDVSTQTLKTRELQNLNITAFRYCLVAFLLILVSLSLIILVVLIYEWMLHLDRSNLDPFGRHTDQELWKALEKCHIKGMVSANDDFVNMRIIRWNMRLISSVLRWLGDWHFL